MRPAKKIKKNFCTTELVSHSLAHTRAFSLSGESAELFCDRLTARDVGPRASKPEIKVFSRGQNKNGKVKMKR